MQARHEDEELASQVNDSFERMHREFLASQLRELESLGMAHVSYALSARRCLERYAEFAAAPSRRAGDRPSLRLVSGDS